MVYPKLSDKTVKTKIPDTDMIDMKTAQTRKLAWHFPRTKEADVIMNLLDDDLTTRIALFAPRRRGKTMFITRDITAIARKMGYTVLYVNFWLKKSDPAYCIAAAIHEALENERNRWFRRFIPIKNDLSIALDNLGINLERVEPGAQNIDSGQIIFLLDQFFRSHKKTLLLLDEAQQLTMDIAFEDITFGLRTLLDNHRENVRSIFTGSSRNGLNNLLRQRNAAFFNSSLVHDLGKLESDFCQYACNVYAQHTGHELNLPDLVSVFKNNHSCPYWLNAIMQYMVLHGTNDVIAAAAYTMNNDALYAHFASDWNNLMPIEKAAMINLIEPGNNRFYPENNAALISNLAGVEQVSQSDPETALNQLQEKGYLYKSGREKWDFEDDHFRDWIIRTNNLETPRHTDNYDNARE